MKRCLIIDKSTIQGLSYEELAKLGQRYWPVATPILVREIGGDAARHSREVAIELSRKLLAPGNTLFTTAFDFCFDANLDGHPVAMELRPFRMRAEEVQEMTDSDGSRSFVILPSEEQVAIERWAKGSITDVDVRESEAWANHVRLLKSEELREGLDPLGEDVRTLQDLSAFVDRLMQNPRAQLPLLRWAFGHYELASVLTDRVLRRWEDYPGSPKLVLEFAPYCHFVLRTAWFFLLGIGAGLVPSRRTNWIDLQYFYYLPFGQVFCSSDKFHRLVFPYLCLPGQEFLDGEDLRRDLARDAK